MPQLGSQQITTALTNEVVKTVTGLTDKDRITLVAQFTYGSGGTTAKAYIQTSLDAGSTWYDIACFAFATTTANEYQCVAAGPGATVSASVALTTGSLSDDTAINGLLGDRIRMVVTSTGTYAGGTTLEVDYYATA